MHAVLPVNGLWNVEQALGHVIIGFPFLATGIHLKDVAEALFPWQVFLQLQQVETIVGNAAHLHGDAVRQYGE